MNLATQGFALLAGLLHVLIFCLESLWFMRPRVHKRFGAATREQAEAARLFALNQGFYNLFLALGIFAGLALLHAGSHPAVARTLVLFCCACMLGAGAVLFLSAGRAIARAATIQVVFPLLTWVTWWVL